MTMATVFVWLAVLCPAISLIVPKGLAPLMVVVTLAVAALQWREKRMPPIARTPVLLFGALLVWGLVTLFWSLEPLRGLVTVGRLAFLFYGGLLLAGAAGGLAPDDRRRIGKALWIGVFVAVALLAEELLTGGALFNVVLRAEGKPLFQSYYLNPATTSLALLLWPALIALYRRGGAWACAAGLAAGVVVLTTTESATAAVAVALGALIAGWGLLGRSCTLVRRLAVAGVLVATLAGPAYSIGVELVHQKTVPSFTLSSLLHRLYIWDFAARHIREKPVFGWGLDSSRAIPGGHTPRVIIPGRTRIQSIIDGYKANLMPLHPHNAGLQVWLELGVPGMLLYLGFLVWLLKTMGRRVLPGALPCLCLAQFACTYVIAEVSYGIWQSWWLSGIALAGALTVALLPREVEAGGSD